MKDWLSLPIEILTSFFWEEEDVQESRSEIMSNHLTENKVQTGANEKEDSEMICVKLSLLQDFQSHNDHLCLIDEII